jgi:hypothetical protein
VTLDRLYIAYLLRLWHENDDGTDAWRASLENSRTGEQRGFASLECLFVYLKNQTHSRIEDKELDDKEK